MLKSFAWLALLSAVPLITQFTPRNITLTKSTNIPAADIEQELEKQCPNVSLSGDATKSDYTLEVRRKTNEKGIQDGGYDLTLLYRDGETVLSNTSPFLSVAVRSVCRAINGSTKRQKPEIRANSP